MTKRDLIPLSQHPGRRRRRGFTLTEMIIATALATMLGMLLAMACVTFGRPAMEVEARARITQEAILAAQSLASDLGGFLPDGSGYSGPVGQYLSTDNWGQTGLLSQYGFTGWNLSNDGVLDLSNGDLLVLSFGGPPSNQGLPVFITYQLVGDNFPNNPPLFRLIRSNSSTNVTTTIAKYVTAFNVESNSDNSQATITFKIAFRYFTATYTLIAVKPPS